MIDPPAFLLAGRTWHRREAPFVRAFSHRIALVELDVDRLDEADRTSWLFGVDRFAAASVHAADQGERRRAASLRGWAEARFAEAGVQLDGGQVRLCAFPRVWGYGFSPLSLWFGYGPDGDVRGVIYEVHNTFGETHAYVCAFDPGQLAAEAQKEFFVSPFFERSGRYRFTLRQSDSRIDLTVENIAADGRRHVATMNVERTALTTARLARMLLMMPLSGIGVMLAIHWQALILLLKGARRHVKPPQRPNRTTPVEPPAPPQKRLQPARKRA